MLAGAIGIVALFVAWAIITAIATVRICESIDSVKYELHMLRQGLPPPPKAPPRPPEPFCTGEYVTRESVGLPPLEKKT